MEKQLSFSAIIGGTMTYLMGIDLGTSSVKCLITDEKGTQITSHSINYDVLVPQAGYAQQDPQMWWESAVLCISAALKKCGISTREIKAIGLSGQMHGTVLMGKNKEVLYPAILHCDGRSQSEIEEISHLFNENQFSKINYNPLFTGSQIASLLWVKRHQPKIYENICYVILPKDYIRFCLTGELGTDITDASGTLLFDMKQCSWSKSILEKLEVSPDKLTKIHRSDEIAGLITDEASKLTGLQKGTPVVFGAGDQSAQALGNGVIKPGIATSNIGTAGQIFVPTLSPIYNPKLNTNTFCHIPQNT